MPCVPVPGQWQRHFDPNRGEAVTLAQPKPYVRQAPCCAALRTSLLVSNATTLYAPSKHVTLTGIVVDLVAPERAPIYGRHRCQAEACYTSVSPLSLCKLPSLDLKESYRTLMHLTMSQLLPEDKYALVAHDCLTQILSCLTICTCNTDDRHSLSKSPSAGVVC